MCDGDVPTNYWGWHIVEYVVSDSIPAAIGLGIFSAEEMVSCGFSVALDGLGVDLFNVGQYRYRISNLNYGLPGCRALVCVGRKITWALDIVCINSVDFEFFSDRFVPEVFA